MPENPEDRDGQKEDQKDDKKSDDKQQDDKKAEKKPLWPWIVAAIIVIGFIVTVLLIIFLPSRYVWTDDAYVMAHYTTIAPRISGQIVAVDVTDNQVVRQGTSLARIDDRDYQTAVDEAYASLQADRAQADETTGQVIRQPAIIEQARAQLASATAQLEFARVNDARYHSAAATGADTQQDRQQAESQLRQAEAAVAGDQAAMLASEQQLPVLQAQQQAALANIASGKARLAQARLNLSYTIITAPLDGMVGELSVQVGNYVAPGDALMAVVPLAQVYIEANYRELALRRVVPGQHVRIHLDAYDIYLDGTVDSIPPASGASFAPIEPNNATGNFTKIVQRLPVKIVVAPNQPNFNLFRVGMSVETTIDTGAQQNIGH